MFGLLPVALNKAVTSCFCGGSLGYPGGTTKPPLEKGFMSFLAKGFNSQSSLEGKGNRANSSYCKEVVSPSLHGLEKKDQKEIYQCVISYISGHGCKIIILLDFILLFILLFLKSCLL